MTLSCLWSQAILIKCLLELLKAQSLKHESLKTGWIRYCISDLHSSFPWASPAWEGFIFQPGQKNKWQTRQIDSKDISRRHILHICSWSKKNCIEIIPDRSTSTSSKGPRAEVLAHSSDNLNFYFLLIRRVLLQADLNASCSNWSCVWLECKFKPRQQPSTRQPVSHCVLLWVEWGGELRGKKGQDKNSSTIETKSNSNIIMKREKWKEWKK